MSIENEYIKGKKVWIPHTEKNWVSAIIYEDYDAGQMKLKVQQEKSDEIETLTLTSNEELPPLCLSEDDLLDKKSNLVSLTVRHEASVLSVLRTRFERFCIYNYCGISMVFLNPYTKLSIIEDQKILNYRGQMIDFMDPHIFAVAEKVYCRLEREHYDQSIIFSGESGSGKTENAELVILYLATVGAKEIQIKEKIRASSTILQAFGNAKTIKNDNSSRFAKWIELQYDTNHHVIGANLKTYFLDRSRVTFQGQGEQNFNIFVYLRSDKDRLHLLQLDKEKYRYINQENITTLCDKNNLSQFDKTLDAFNVLGFSTKQQNEILCILAAILHLGNVNFEKSRTPNSDDNLSEVTAESCIISGLSHLQTLVKVFGLELKSVRVMRKWLCHKRIVFQQDEILQPMTVEEALKARDSLAKFIYTKLFNWIVARINALFRSPCNVQSYIGVLDVYGFEKLDSNSFEQFCINYTDEKVQQYFIQSVFKSIQEEYVNEEIAWTSISFPDNKLCADLFEGKNGIIEIVDEESKISRDSNIPWVENLYSKCEKAEHFEKPVDNTSTFIIRHFTGHVQYETTNFLEKTREVVIKEQLEVLKDTKNDLLKKLIMDDYSKVALPKGKRQSSKSVRMSLNIRPAKKSILTEFRNSIAMLMATLNQTTPYHVRCIKPNDEKKVFEFNPFRVALQLQNFNILNIIEISLVGFFSQSTYAAFFQRYHCLHEFESINRDDVPETCRNILATNIEDSQNFRCGKTKIFLREDAVQHLEQLRSEKRNKACIMIQKKIRCFLEELRYFDIKLAVLCLQCHGRGCLARRRAHAIREERAAIKIQSWARGWLKCRRYLNLRCSALTLQACVKLQQECQMSGELQQVDTMASAATEIQRRIRGFLARRERERRLRNIITVQACVRRFLAKIAMHKLKKNQDERIKLLNRSMENKLHYLDGQMTNMMETHLTPRELQHVHVVSSNQEIPYARNKIVNEIIFKKLDILKELREREEKMYKLREVEYKELDAYEVTKRIEHFELLKDFDKHRRIQEEEDLTPYYKLFDSYRQFDLRAEWLKRMIGLDEVKITELRSMKKASEENDFTLNIHGEYNDETSNNVDPQMNTSLEECHENELREDNSTSSMVKHEANKTYAGMLQFKVEEVDSLMIYLFIELDPSTIIMRTPELPGQILFMCIRYSDSLDDLSGAFLLLQSYIKTVRRVVKDRWQLNSTVLWLASTHRLMNYLKQYSKVDNNEYCDVYTARQIEQCLSNLDLSNQSRALNDIAQWLVRKAEQQMIMRTREFVVPGLLDNEEITKLGENLLASEQEQDTPLHKLGRLLEQLTCFYDLLRKCRVDYMVIEQIFAKMFDFFCSVALADLTSQRKYCRSYKCLYIRCNLRHIERWATNHHLSFDAFHPILQAARFLQIQPIEPHTVDYIYSEFNKLNYDQIMKILNIYIVANENEVTVSPDAIKRLQSKIMEREELNDTVIVDAETNLVEFVFRPSDDCFERIEIPSVFNLSMLKKI